MVKRTAFVEQNNSRQGVRQYRKAISRKIATNNSAEDNNEGLADGEVDKNDQTVKDDELVRKIIAEDPNKGPPYVKSLQAKENQGEITSDDKLDYIVKNYFYINDTISSLRETILASQKETKTQLDRLGDTILFSIANLKNQSIQNDLLEWIQTTLSDTVRVQMEEHMASLKNSYPDVQNKKIVKVQKKRGRPPKNKKNIRKDEESDPEESDYTKPAKRPYRRSKKQRNSKQKAPKDIIEEKEVEDNQQEAYDEQNQEEECTNPKSNYDEKDELESLNTTNRYFLRRKNNNWPDVKADTKNTPENGEHGGKNKGSERLMAFNANITNINNDMDNSNEDYYSNDAEFKATDSAIQGNNSIRNDKVMAGGPTNNPCSNKEDNVNKKTNQLQVDALNRSKKVFLEDKTDYKTMQTNKNMSKIEQSKLNQAANENYSSRRSTSMNLRAQVDTGAYSLNK